MLLPNPLRRNAGTAFAFLLWYCLELSTSAQQPASVTPARPGKSTQAAAPAKPCQSPGTAKTSQLSHPPDLVIDLNALSKESRRSFENLLGDVIAQAANKNLKSLEITDPIELRLLADFQQFVRTEATPTAISLFVVKPGDTRRSECREIEDDGKVQLRYTRVTDRLAEPFAIVTLVYVDGRRLSIRDQLMRYKPGIGWRPCVEQNEKAAERVTPPSGPAALRKQQGNPPSDARQSPK